MAASAFKHSKLSVVKLDTAGGTLTEISDSCNSVDMPEELDLLETTTLGATSKTYIIGFADGTVSLEGFWNRTLDGHLNGLKAGFRDGTLDSASFEYGPEGTSSGCVKYTCEVVMTSYEKSTSIEDPVTFSSEFQITGAVTVGTY